jgi:magnesium chelatase family protein
MLVAASNPCPCGRGESSTRCRCPEASVRRYQSKLSGALADRIDLSVRVEQPTASALRSGPGESSAAVRERVAAARERQARRLGAGSCNAGMTSAETRRACRLDGAAERLLARSHDRLGLSGRGYERVLRVARTHADLDARERVEARDVEAALTMRRRVAGP